VEPTGIFDPWTEIKDALTSSLRDDISFSSENIQFCFCELVENILKNYILQHCKFNSYIYSFNGQQLESFELLQSSN